jgi:hypothetical protein
MKAAWGIASIEVSVVSRLTYLFDRVRRYPILQQSKFKKTWK